MDLSDLFKLGLDDLKAEAGTPSPEPGVDRAKSPLDEPAETFSPDDLPPLRQAMADGYRINGRIGKGGSGVVYAADMGPQRVPVAIKAYKPNAKFDGSDCERLLRDEFELVRDRLGGQTVEVAKALGFGGRGDSAYAVFEWVEGARAIDAWAESQGLGIDARIALAERVLVSVASIHEAGVVHGDLKPEHLLTPDGAKVVVLDFGVAFACDARAGLSEGLRITGATDGLAAPEQVDGDGRVIGPGSKAADVYTLSLILRELVFDQAKDAPGWCRQTLLAMGHADPSLRPPDAAAALVMWRQNAGRAKAIRRRWWVSRGVAAAVLLLMVVAGLGVWSGRPGQFSVLFSHWLSQPKVSPSSVDGGRVTAAAVWPLETALGKTARTAWHPFQATHDRHGLGPTRRRRLAVFDRGTGVSSRVDLVSGWSHPDSAGALITWVQGRHVVRLFDAGSGDRWHWRVSEPVVRVFLGPRPLQDAPRPEGVANGSAYQAVLGLIHASGAVTLLDPAGDGVMYQRRDASWDFLDARIGPDHRLWLTAQRRGEPAGRHVLSVQAAGKTAGARPGGGEPVHHDQADFARFFPSMEAVGAAGAAGTDCLLVCDRPEAGSMAWRAPVDSPWAKAGQAGRAIRVPHDREPALGTVLGQRWAAWVSIGLTGLTEPGPAALSVYDAESGRLRRWPLTETAYVGGATSPGGHGSRGGSGGNGDHGGHGGNGSNGSNGGLRVSEAALALMEGRGLLAFFDGSQVRLFDLKTAEPVAAWRHDHGVTGAGPAGAPAIGAQAELKWDALRQVLTLADGGGVTQWSWGQRPGQRPGLHR